jgi:hypothetical protein
MTASKTKLTMCEHIEIKGGHCVACMEEGKLAFAKVSSNYSVGYKEGRASAIKEVIELIKSKEWNDCKLMKDICCGCIMQELLGRLEEKELGGTK